MTGFSTGVDVLDRRLHGGVLPGSLVVLSVDPASQSELFLSKLASTRPTLYLTTERSASAVRTFLERTGAAADDCAVREVNSDKPLESAYRSMSDLPPESNLILDPMDALEEASGPRYWSFVNAVRDVVEERDAIAVLHCLNGRRVPPRRDTTEYMADVVFDLSTDLDGDAIETRLFVPKVRGGEAMSQAVKLDLTDDVSVDTSRDIA